MVVRFAIGRLLQLIAVLAVLWFATVFMVRLVPGDPAQRILGLNATPTDIARTRALLGLNRSLGAEAGHAVYRLWHLDLGSSFVTGEPVTSVISERLPNTAKLAGSALCLVLLAGVPLGVAAGALTSGDKHRQLNTAFGSVTSIAGAMPEYVWATFLVFLLAVKLKWLPAAGASGSRSLLLPALSVGLAPAALLARVVRVETVKVLSQDYIRTARSKRLPSWYLYLRHVLPNVMTAVLTVGGLVFTSLIGGAVIVENVFAWPGLGTAVVSAVISRDYPVVQGVILLLGATVVVINGVVDILANVIDPAAT
jgi:peptide/nickel transport system permease protein